MNHNIINKNVTYIDITNTENINIIYGKNDIYINVTSILINFINKNVLICNELFNIDPVPNVLKELIVTLNNNQKFIIKEDDYVHLFKLINNNITDIIIWGGPFNINCGGVVALYNLARIINKNINFKAYIYAMGTHIENNICVNYIVDYNKLTTNPNTVAIYPEGIKGNPLGANRVVRWILLEYNLYTSEDIKKSWKTSDLIYRWESGINQLSCPYVNNVFKIYNISKNRNMTCYIIKKGRHIHTNINKIHPDNSINIERIEHSPTILNQIADIFNRSTYFYCYDPNCFFAIYATLCGCITILQPINGVSRSEYFKNRIYSFKDSIYDCGIAYGNSKEEIDRAIQTLPNASIKIKEMIDFYESTVTNFLISIMI
jgi:hypothetical protein